MEWSGGVLCMCKNTKLTPLPIPPKTVRNRIPNRMARLHAQREHDPGVAGLGPHDQHGEDPGDDRRPRLRNRARPAPRRAVLQRTVARYPADHGARALARPNYRLGPGARGGKRAAQAA